MKVLVLGASGMLGHKLIQRLSSDFEVTGTLRGQPSELLCNLSKGVNLVSGVSATNIETVRHVIEQVQPDVLINCIGVIKQRKTAKDPIDCTEINALFPHRLAKICKEQQVRMIHFSTDCVFSGRSGPYSEVDIADAEDLYGRTKHIGEVDSPGALTLRVSIIGRELVEKASLVEWFLSKKGEKVSGYTQALYTGFTTAAMADLLAMLMVDQPDLSGVWHASTDPISKFDLLTMINAVYKLGIVIEKDDSFFCDRRLDSSRFRARTGFQPLSWGSMIEDMYLDPTSY